MNDVDASIEKAITKFQIVMLYLNKEIIEMVNESSHKPTFKRTN